MLSWLMGNLCDKSERDSSPAVAVEISAKHAMPTDEPKQLVHSAAVNCLAQLGSSLLLSGCKDGNLALYDCAKRLLLSRISGAHEREVTAVAASPSQLCASGSRDKSLRFWRVDAPSEGSNLNLEPAGDLPDAHELVVSAVDFNSLDGSQLVTGSRDNTVKLWDAVAQQQISSAVVSRNLVTHIRWVPNSHQFLQSGEDKELKLWDSRPLKVVGTFSRKQYIQTCCDVRQDGDQCVSSSNGFGGNGCEATVWDMRSKKPLLELIGHSESVLTVGYYDDTVVTGSADATVRQWDPTVGRETAILPVEGAGPIACVRPLPQVANGLIGAATFNRGVCLCSVGSDSLSLSHRY
ncbi:hypothetical protein BOX15_Mlig018873g1 [Macrostomum lignano]|uniref:Uncharacterized protein n=2 Tax=Macrostomum lignano TaxID=282301 RepID=A0A267GNU9_9PLAT|nr:hypothetical protein BOX15_Mlig018873g1 [Macrostomum lignano]